MSGWNHRIRLATEAERRQARWVRGEWTPGAPARCSSPRCREEAVYMSGYDYVTGKGGRVSDQRRLLCFGHAQRFANKWGLALPEDPDHPERTRMEDAPASDPRPPSSVL